MKVNIKRIQRAMGDRGLTIYALAKESKLSYHGCWNIVKGKTASIRFRTLNRLCSALHIGSEEFFTKRRRDADLPRESGPPTCDNVTMGRQGGEDSASNDHDEVQEG